MREIVVSPSRRNTLLVAIAIVTGLTVGIVVPLSASLRAPGAEAAKLVRPVQDDGFLHPVAGVGEKMLIVVGADFATASEANAAYKPFGEMQGFYVDASDNYRVIGLYEQTSPVSQSVVLRYVPATGGAAFLAGKAPCGGVDVPPCVRERLSGLLTPDLQLRPGRQLLLSAFRTKAGAALFAEHARVAGYDEVVVLRVVKTGGPYVGLGQEANPDGSGPLTEPLANPDTDQE